MFLYFPLEYSYDNLDKMEDLPREEIARALSIHVKYFLNDKGKQRLLALCKMSGQNG